MLPVNSPGPRERTVAYTYFQNGTRKSVTDPEGRVTEYSYDGQNRLKTATTNFGTPEAAATSYGYTPDDLLQSVAYPNGVTAAHTYDKADRLLSITNARGGTVLSSYQYQGTAGGGQPVSYDRNGNRLIQVETNGGLVETTTYSYDALNRLKTIKYPIDSSFANGRLVTYGYDKVGNRTSEIETDPVTSTAFHDKTALFDALNRLTSVADSAANETTAFGYDRNGNQTSKTVTTGSGSTTTSYLFDERDKLVEARQGTSTLERLQYCYDGQRTQKIGLEGVRQYLYDDDSLLLEYDDVGASVAKYDYGSDRLISLLRRDEARRFYSFDGLRSVVNLSAADGSVAASYHLDAWGNHRFPAEPDASKNRFGFTGYELDKETGLYNAKARYFDPQFGRFITQDSLLGQIDDPPSLHRYFYANANPTRFVDPTGHEAAIITMASIDPETRKRLEEQGKVAAAGAIEGTGWAIGSVARQAYDAGHGLVALGKLSQDPAAQGRLLLKALEKVPLLAEATLGNPNQRFLAQMELMAPVIESRVQAYEKGIDEYALAKSPIERGWIATGTVNPEASIAAGGIYGLLRRGGVAAGIVAERNATIDAIETAAAAQRAESASSVKGAVVPGRGVGEHGVNLLEPQPGGRAFSPQRPTWQGSEQFFESELAEFGFTGQRSYLGGRVVPRGTPGSVRPDVISDAQMLSVDVKNYNFATAQGRYAAQRDILGQLKYRAANLPSGMRQGVILDARGQWVSKRTMDALVRRLEAKSGGLLASENIHVAR